MRIGNELKKQYADMLRRDMNQDEVDEIRLRFSALEPEATGYHILIRPIDATQGMEAAQMDLAPELAAAGFQMKTDHEQSRQSKGSDIGLVIHLGPEAYQHERFGDPWCEIGDIVLFKRYEGHQFEFPPGSGTRYHLVNDEDIFGALGDKS